MKSEMTKCEKCPYASRTLVDNDLWDFKCKLGGSPKSCQKENGMGLYMDFYKLPKGTKIESWRDLSKFKEFKHFRKNYTIHEIMCLSALMIAKRYATLSRVPSRYLPFPYTYGGFEYKISKEQYEIIKEILKADDLGKLVEDYDEDDKPEQLLEILKDFDDYDFWYSWTKRE